MTSRKVAVGSLVMVAKRWSVRLLSLVSTVILARLLLPTDFGLLALVLSFTVLLEAFTEFNFDLSLVRREKVDDTHYNTAWTLNVIGNTTVAVILIIVAPWFASFARAPEATLVMQAVALCIMIDGTQNIGMVAWRREMKFGPEFKLEFWRKVVEVGVAVAFALQWPTVWALVAGMFAGRIVGWILSYALHPFRPRFTLMHWREMAGFSGLAVGYGLATKLAWRADYFVISRTQSLTAVGLYSNAQVIATLPTMELVRPIGVALFSGFSALLNDHARLREAYLKALSGLLLIALPMAAGVAFTAEGLVYLLLGNKWLDCIPLLKGLAVVQIVHLSSASSVSLLMALDKMKGVFYRSVAMAVIRPTILFFTMHWYGFEAAPIAIFIAIALQVSLDSYYVRRALNFSALLWVRRTWRPYVATGTMALALWGLMPDAQVDSIASAFGQLGWGLLIGAPVYVAVALGLWRLEKCPDGVERMILGMVDERLRRLRAPR